MNTDQAMTAFVDIYFRALKQFTTALQMAVNPYQLSFEQYQIMRDIATKRVTTLTDIVRLRGVTKPAIARQISSLLRLNYIGQDTASDDHRRRILHLTLTGAEIETTITAIVRQRFQGLIRAMGRDELTQLTKLLTQLNAAFVAVDQANNN